VSFGGFGGGSPMFGGGGGSRSAAAPGGGLPFAGIPSELQDGVDNLLAREPEYPEPSAAFGYINNDERSKHLNLSQLIFRHWRLGAMAVLLVCIVSVANQLGPALISYAIDHGMPPAAHSNMTVVAVCAGLFLVAILISALAQRSQARVTGRLAARVMNDLRVKVFTQLQRLGLNYYTEEKAGVIMTRMTSDIENLQQLLQDGLAQLVAQVLTMVVITVILFTMNVELTLITLALVVPILTVATIWFSRASQDGYQRVRDGIAGVLGDLSESLQGVRTVAAFNRQRWNVVQHRNVVGAYRDANNHTAQINALYGPGTQMLGYLSQGALLAIGGNMVLHGQLSYGQLIAFFLYLNRFFAPIQLLVQQYNTFQQGQSSVIKLRTLFRTDPSTPQRPDELRTHDLLTPDAAELPEFRLQLARGAQRAEVPLTPKLAVDDPAVLHAATAAGLGIGLLPEFLCRQGLATGRLKVVLSEWSVPPAAALYALYPSALESDPRAQQFVDFLAANIVPALALPAVAH